MIAKRPFGSVIPNPAFLRSTLDISPGRQVKLSALAHPEIITQDTGIYLWA